MIEFNSLDRSELRTITATLDKQTMAVAEEIVSEIVERGEVAVRHYATKFDQLPDSDPLFIDRSGLEAAAERIPQQQLQLLERVADRVGSFAEAQRQSLQDNRMEIAGGWAGHRWLPLEVAGCYAPAGRYPLPSSVLMTAVTARVAGVKEVWVASPKPADIMLAAAAVAKADGFLVAGGAQAIAAMACGLPPSMPAADVIVGPGNRYVTAAKSIVSRRTRIDMLAGPSELVVVAGQDASAAIVAADLLAQAEHDPDARPILITTRQSLVDEVVQQLESQLQDLPTADVAVVALAAGGYLVVDSVDDAIECCRDIAPEHLELQGTEVELQADRFYFGAAVFIGSNTAEVYGDYGAGPNHVLPTGGAARAHGGLSVATFMRLQTQLKIESLDGAKEMVDDAIALGQIEGLIGHARSAAIRQN